MEWLSRGSLIQARALLLDNPVVTIKACFTPNPPTLLPTEMEALVHDCTETIDTI